jgi:glycosyltransferase involved in cell wall biosynthesis
MPQRPPLSSPLVFNIRTLQAAQSGVQRYARELDERWGDQVERLRPPASIPAQGIKGHLWEQFVLPAHCRGRLLFSPGNTGPLAYKQQIVTIHDASTFDQAEAFTGLFARWYRWLLPRLARRARCIITVSRFSRDRICARLGISPEHVQVIYNGVTPPPNLSRSVLDKEYERLDLPERFLLFVGSQDPRKNVSRLLRAFSRARLGNVELLLAGGADPLLFSSSSSTPKSIPRVRALGRVSDNTLEALYARAEGFIFPSVYEGFGLPPLEAMARGCPVLTSDASCLPEVCGPALEQGGACLYFSPHSTEAITGALEYFCNLPQAAKDAMAAAGRERARQYSWDRCAADTFSLLLQHSGTNYEIVDPAVSQQPLSEIRVA